MRFLRQLVRQAHKNHSFFNSHIYLKLEFYDSKERPSFWNRAAFYLLQILADTQVEL